MFEDIIRREIEKNKYKGSDLDEKNKRNNF